MSDAATVPGASAILHELWPNGKVGERIRDASRALRWSYSRTKDFWYGQARTIHGHETLRLQEIRNERAAARREEVRKIAHDQDELTQRLDRMEALLSVLVSGMAGKALPEVQQVLRESRGAVAAGNLSS